MATRPAEREVHDAFHLAEDDEVWILANNHPVARGEIQIHDDKIAISVTGPADVYDFMAAG